MFKISVLQVLAILVCIVTAACLTVWWFWEAPLLSPLSGSPIFQFLTDQDTPGSTGKVVYGFLPYWNASDVTLQPEMTHLSYFSLTVLGDGTIQTREDTYTEPGYNMMQSDTFFDLANQQTSQGGKVELTITQFNNDDIVQLINSPTAQDQFLNSLDSALLAYPFSGVNIDIEYTGQVTPELRQNLVIMMRKIREHLNQKYFGVQLSIDMYATAVTSENIWDVPAIAEQVDYIVVMAYDFHRRSSPLAGPVAPLFGGHEYWSNDISQQLKAFLDVVPSEKILLGVPFYGYEWQTTSTDPQATTYPDTGSTASYKRVQELMARKTELQVEERWNEAALSPYLSYKEDGNTYVIYYEDSRSLSYKLDFVNQLDLGGIAIWALGYEGNSRELWDTINQKLDAS